MIWIVCTSQTLRIPYNFLVIYIQNIGAIILKGKNGFRTGLQDVLSADKKKKKTSINRKMCETKLGSLLQYFKPFQVDDEPQPLT